MFKKDFLVTRVHRFADRLDVPIVYANACDAIRWAEDFRCAGAQMWCERARLSKITYSPQIAAGAKLVVISTVQPHEYATLVRIVETKEDNKKVICFPGGVCNLWKYGDRVELEHPVLTAYRGFEEEVGEALDVPYLKYFTFSCSTNHSEGLPDAYAPNIFYLAEIPYEKFMRYAIDGGSNGDIISLSLNQLESHEYIWHESSEEAFEMCLTLNERKRQECIWNESYDKWPKSARENFDLLFKRYY